MTIAEELATVGYSYRASRMEGRQEVYCVATGEVVGQLTAHEVVQFLEALG